MKNVLLYPVDNSFSFCLEDGSSDCLLAGTHKTPSNLVTVISDPFKMPIERYGKVHIFDFVLVVFEGKRYCVLNNLSETEPHKEGGFDYGL